MREGRRTKMALLIVLLVWIALDVVVWFWGYDSRDGWDWKPRPSS